MTVSRTASPTVLALDSAAGACSAALWRQGRLAGHRYRAMARGHAEALLPMVIETMAAAGAGFDELDLIAATVGPGAFTGLRIGLATARGLALATGVPALGVTTFAAVAEAVPPAERTGRTLLVLLDTKRSDLFAQRFDAELEALGAPAVLSVDALEDWIPDGPVIVAGDGVALARPVLSGLATRCAADIAYATAGDLPDAAHVARIAARLFASGTSRGTSGETPGGLPAVPLYLRAPAVTAPRDAGR
ncbi:tRNA (adenosine(37)-N6)-threonylcarbamoyltransferase complex dimerization subunit type 1 TsaB [Rhodospirillaceae bacterium SYSU D60014]|uniref:tRNA (adenosine(37)-N6)-threonylcarbamoyltransferase complex dimerization subunit type 1 TsaB n=1 Tax=Virgifigura deserti TaxID=2268457 RepID=UPI000E66418E